MYGVAILRHVIISNCICSSDLHSIQDQAVPQIHTFGRSSQLFISIKFKHFTYLVSFLLICRSRWFVSINQLAK